MCVFFFACVIVLYRAMYDAKASFCSVFRVGSWWMYRGSHVQEISTRLYSTGFVIATVIDIVAAFLAACVVLVLALALSLLSLFFF